MEATRPNYSLFNDATLVGHSLCKPLAYLRGHYIRLSGGSGPKDVAARVAIAIAAIMVLPLAAIGMAFKCVHMLLMGRVQPLARDQVDDENAFSEMLSMAEGMRVNPDETFDAYLSRYRAMLSPEQQRFMDIIPGPIRQALRFDDDPRPVSIPTWEPTPKEWHCLLAAFGCLALSRVCSDSPVVESLFMNGAAGLCIAMVASIGRDIIESPQVIEKVRSYASNLWDYTRNVTRHYPTVSELANGEVQGDSLFDCPLALEEPTDPVRAYTEVGRRLHCRYYEASYLEDWRKQCQGRTFTDPANRQPILYTKKVSLAEYQADRQAARVVAVPGANSAIAL